jgi:ribosomal protein L32
MTTARERATESEWRRRARREHERAVYVAEHGNVCELCGKPPKSRGLSEDHDHKTEAHRGWLCYRCNIILRPYVTLEWLRKAVAYLERAAAR